MFHRRNDIGRAAEQMVDVVHASLDVSLPVINRARRQAGKEGNGRVPLVETKTGFRAAWVPGIIASPGRSCQNSATRVDVATSPRPTRPMMFAKLEETPTSGSEYEPAR